jgi:superfamily II DNA helicase RecQ
LHSGEKDGLVCTTALAAGMDYPYVQLTIHIGLPRNATIFKQQAKQDGERAWNFIISRQGTQPWEIKKNNDLAGSQFMWDFVHREQKCYTLQELSCDICKVGKSNANL